MAGALLDGTKPRSLFRTDKGKAGTMIPAFLSFSSRSVVKSRRPRAERKSHTAWGGAWTLARTLSRARRDKQKPGASSPAFLFSQRNDLEPHELSADRRVWRSDAWRVAAGGRSFRI